MSYYYCTLNPFQCYNLLKKKYTGRNLVKLRAATIKLNTKLAQFQSVLQEKTAEHFSASEAFMVKAENAIKQRASKLEVQDLINASIAEKERAIKYSAQDRFLGNIRSKADEKYSLLWNAHNTSDALKDYTKVENSKEFKKLEEMYDNLLEVNDEMEPMNDLVKESAGIMKGVTTQEDLNETEASDKHYSVSGESDLVTAEYERLLLKIIGPTAPLVPAAVPMFSNSRMVEIHRENIPTEYATVQQQATLMLDNPMVNGSDSHPPVSTGSSYSSKRNNSKSKNKHKATGLIESLLTDS